MTLSLDSFPMRAVESKEVNAPLKMQLKKNLSPNLPAII